MAKQKKLPPADAPDARDEESLLLRSAESLGRVIGALQRQLDGATRRLAETADVFDRERTTPGRSASPRKTRGATAAAKGGTSRSRKTAGTRKGAKKAAPAASKKRTSPRKARR